PGALPAATASRDPARPLPGLRPGRRALTQRVVRVGGAGGAGLRDAGGGRGGRRAGHGGAGRALRRAGARPRSGRVGPAAPEAARRPGLAGGAGARSGRPRPRLLLGPDGRGVAGGLPASGGRAPLPVGGTARPLLSGVLHPNGAPPSPNGASPPRMS